jgi:O-glycosyl hydrolase
MRSPRIGLPLVIASLLVIGSGSGRAVSNDGVWAETRFRTGCDPGPSHPPRGPDPRIPSRVSAEPPEQVALHVDFGSQAAGQSRPILGVGFNFEHALWSCPEFRGLFRSEILDSFMPAIARVDSGLLPAAPAELSAEALGPAVYESVLASAPYADSWSFFRTLNRAGVKIVLGVWGGPSQFTDDGTRRGVLLPEHYDDYVDYIATMVQFMVLQQRIDLWATTIANEPDGGDGNQIPPDGLAYIAHQLAPRVVPLGVKLYGPDTASSANALLYLPPLLDDPVVADNLAFVGFHQYFAGPELSDAADFVHARRPDLPVIVTEYTSFGFGDLDDGQEASNQYGFTLEIASMLLSHLRWGADAALYWDAVDYLQPGHDAITRWGVLQGPGRDFARRVRYYGMLQIMRYLQPGAQVLPDHQEGGSQLHTLAVRTPGGDPAMFLVSQDYGPLDITLDLAGASQFASWVVTRTERGHLAERLGRLKAADGLARLTLPPRSITTLFPAGVNPVEDAPE